MNNEASTPEPKSRKPGNPSSTGARKTRRPQRRPVTHHGNAQPEWDDANEATTDAAGDFDESGQFILKDAHSGPNTSRKGKNRRASGQNFPLQSIPAWGSAADHAKGGDLDPHGDYIKDENSTSDSRTNTTNSKKSKSRQIHQQPILSMPQSIPQVSASPSRPKGFGATPIKAYAGPTFHASPAASELPMPKFFSKSAPKAASPAGLMSRLQHEDSQDSRNDKKDSSSSTDSSPRPFPALIQKPKAREGSPLDIFFDADRHEKAEKAKNLNHGPSNSAPPTAHPPPAMSSNNVWAAVYGARPTHQRNHSTGSTKDIFSMDIENDTSSVGGNFDPNSPSRSYFRTPDATPDSSRQYHKNQSQTWSRSPGSPTDRPVSVPTPNQTPYPFTPRSAGTTPSPAYQVPPQEQPLQHYGNRNLSPLFNALKMDNSRRQSGLRQEVLRSPQVRAGEWSAETALGGSTSNQKPATSALDLLNAQIAKGAGQTAPVPGQIRIMQRPKGHFSDHNAQAPHLHAGGRETITARSATGTTSGPSHSDIQSMENDLKKMLNLSNPPGMNFNAHA